MIVRNDRFNFKTVRSIQVRNVLLVDAAVGGELISQLLDLALKL